MRNVFLLFIMLYALPAYAQNDEAFITAKMLALDTTISGGTAFNDQLLQCCPGYSYQFTDRETQNTVLYLYKNNANATIRIEYKYQLKATDSNEKTKPIIYYHKITADDATMAGIYNCIFGAGIKPEQLQGFSNNGAYFNYKDHNYQYILVPDEYKPGYWTLTFVG